MNIDLDRQIAILKGATHDLSGNAFTFYSESDAKALELVDELVTQERNDRLYCFDFGLALSARNPWEWAAWFVPSPTRTGARISTQGRGPTRAEAICRAYLSAREWMNNQGKG